MTFPLFKCDLDGSAADAVLPVLTSGQLAAGPNVPELERRMSAFLQGRAVTAMGDMTHALSMALHLAGVQAGDEVLSLSFNCLSSTTAISSLGARAVWVDVDPATARMSVEDAEQAFTRRTKAVVVYHVAGYPADLAAFRRFCDERGVALIEDANNALGARTSAGVVGSVGDYAVFSFYANRQVNGIDGAALVCPDEATAARARALRRFGVDYRQFRDVHGEIDPRCDVPEIGVSSAISNVNATLAVHGLSTLDRRLSRIRDNAQILQERLGAHPGIIPVRWCADDLPAFWVWMVLCAQRDELMVDLKSRGVQCSKLHYPNHLYTGFGGPPRSLPGTAAMMSRLLALPCGWWLLREEVGRMADVIAHALDQRI